MEKNKINNNIDLNLKVIESIKCAFNNKIEAKIPNLRGKQFKAELCDRGICVNNLGSTPFLSWDVFTETINFLKENGGKTLKGNAMNFKLGDKGLPLDSIEGHIAYKIYSQKIGDWVFRRITPIAAILAWSGTCNNKRGYLQLIK